jgi:hypothetical protein
MSEKLETSMRNESNEKSKLVFVYNADGGAINGIKDYFHKIFSPGTYDCNLCGISFGLGGMKKGWKDYIEELPLPVEFLHRDEFNEQYPNAQKEFPSAWIKTGNQLNLLISQEEINNPKSLDELIELTNNKLKNRNLI